MFHNVTQIFQNLGESIRADWAKAHFNEADFAQIAEQQLNSAQLQQHVSKQDVSDWVLSANSLPTQTNINVNFGDLNLTAYQNDKFYIEILFWLDGTTSIHQHAFSGAFCVLHGNSIHSQYQFEAQRTINRGLLTGNVKCQQVELLKTGDIRQIHSTPGKAHSLFHLNYPNISVVVRTYSEPYAKPQLSYLKPHIAYDPFKTDQLLSQKTKLLGVVEQLDGSQFLSSYEQAVSNTDLASHVMLLINNTKRLFKHKALDSALNRLREVDPTMADALRPSTLQICKTDTIVRWRAKQQDEHLKFFLAILLNAPDRQTSLALIEQKYPEQSPAVLVCRWIAMLVEQEGLINFDIDEQAMPFIECLIEGLDFEQTMDKLGEEYELDELNAMAPILKQNYHHLKYNSVLSGLFKD